jgi:chlorite dismutase
VADATGASTDMMPSSRLVELLQIAKDKSKLFIYYSSKSLISCIDKTLNLLDDEEESDDDYSGKDFDRESPRDDMDINISTLGFDLESMQNARKSTKQQLIAKKKKKKSFLFFLNKKKNLELHQNIINNTIHNIKDLVEQPFLVLMEDSQLLDLMILL